MNKTYSIFIVALLLCSSVGAWAQKQKMLTILHTNDTHSTIFPLSEMLSDTMTAGRGGFMRRVAMIKEERAKDPDLLLFVGLLYSLQGRCGERTDEPHAL